MGNNNKKLCRPIKVVSVQPQKAEVGIWYKSKEVEQYFSIGADSFTPLLILFCGVVYLVVSFRRRKKQWQRNRTLIQTHYEDSSIPFVKRISDKTPNQLCQPMKLNN